MSEFDYPHVKLSKIVSVQKPEGALADTHWLKGYLIEPLAIGERIIVSRYERAGKEEGEPPVVKCPGYFESSPVISISGEYVHTRNSVWRVEQLPPLE